MHLKNYILYTTKILLQDIKSVQKEFVFFVEVTKNVFLIFATNMLSYD